MKRALFAAALALAACSTVPPRVGEPPPEVADPKAEADYHKLFDRWTRHAEVYDKLDTRLFLAATEESVEFRKAKVDRLATFQELPPGARDAMLAKELADAGKGYEFFLGVHTNDFQTNDFDRPWSIWRLSLKTTAGEIAPVLIERLPRANANTRGIYLFLADFWTGYRVVFPANAADGKPVVPVGEQEITLSLASSLGHAELVFPAAPIGVAPSPQ